MYNKALGEVIDLDQTQFEEMTSTYNLGDIKNLILVLENTYNYLRINKDGIIDLVTKGVRKKDDPEVVRALNGLYAEMTKIELKVTHLKTRAEDLSKVWKNTVDTTV